MARVRMVGSGRILPKVRLWPVRVRLLGLGLILNFMM